MHSYSAFDLYAPETATRFPEARHSKPDLFVQSRHTQSKVGPPGRPAASNYRLSSLPLVFLGRAVIPLFTAQ